MMRAPLTELPVLFREVSLRAGDVTVVDRVSLEIVAGAPTCVIGPNGAGKTTLIRLAMGLVKPTSGEIAWGGRTERESPRRAIVFQRPVMLRRSVLANVTYALDVAGKHGDHRARAIELLDQVGLRDLAERPARRLSGGEQQRLALARALARDPEILFLDEPTASLDPAATKAVEDIVAQAANAGVKVVMSTHDLGEARRIAGDIVFMDRARVIEHTPSDRFFTAPQSPEAARFLRGELLV